MKNELIIKRCIHCGATVKVMEDCNCEGCGIICCNEPMKVMVPNSVDAAVEKHVPTYEIAAYNLPISLVDLLANTKLVSSKSEGRRMCEQGGVLVNGETQKDFNFKVSKENFENGVCMLKKGKKNFMKVILK